MEIHTIHAYHHLFMHTWERNLLSSSIHTKQVLFCYEPYDELVLMQLQQFDKKTVTSVEKEMRSGPAEETVVTDDSLELKEQTELTDWVKVTLGQKAAKIKTTSKLESHPCVVTVEEMAAARHFIKTQVDSSIIV